jgi:hypothetical protein
MEYGLDLRCCFNSEIAARERRTLGNLGYLLVEWAADQLQIAGSTEKHRAASRN